MSNKDYCGWLPAFAADDLDPQQQVLFRQHLTQCQDCNLAWENMSLALGSYRQKKTSPLPEAGWQPLQGSKTRPTQRRQRTRFTWQYASAAILALAFFTSGFWMGRTSADQPLPTALHFPLNISPTDDLPEFIRPPFTVALAESIPQVFSHSRTIPR